MIFPSTVMDEEETNADNSVEHYGDHGWKTLSQPGSRAGTWFESETRLVL